MIYFAIQRDDTNGFYECMPFESPQWYISYPFISKDIDYVSCIYNKIRKIQPDLKISIVSFTMKVEIS